MDYKIEQYKNKHRFNEQYEEIHNFLLKTADHGYNEHFHWGRFEWMMCHTLLDIDELEKIALFRDKNNSLVGLVTYDTWFDEGAYLIHSTDDKELLSSMIDRTIRNYRIDGKTVIKANHGDTALNEVLQESGFTQTGRDNTVSTINLEQEFDYCVPKGVNISPQDFVIDQWNYQNVLHKGFNNAGNPEPWDEEVFKPTPNENNALKVFALNETISRAKQLGAKRAIVISEQEFYFRIGFSVSSEIYRWEKNGF